MKDFANLDDLERRIFDAQAALPVIDAHEHFKSEKEFLATWYDWAWLTQYVINDLKAAGLEDSFSIYNNALTPAQKWAKVKPYWNLARQGTAARMFRLSLKEWFGVEDITDENFEQVGRQMNENTHSGFYRQALRDKCNIRCVIANAKHWQDYDDEFIRFIVNIPRLDSSQALADLETRTGLPVRNLDHVQDALRKYFADAISAGAVGFKTIAHPMAKSDHETVGRLVARLVEGGRLAEAEYPIMTRFAHQASFDILRNSGKVVAVHCGCWPDYRDSQTVNMYEIMLHYPEIHFDLFHMGMPSPRQSVLVGKFIPNATHNLAGALLFSQHMFEHALQEYLDIVPVSKMIGFGGDYQWRPELVWGHLQLQRESYARVFAARIRRGMIDLDGAIEALQMWMYDNPKRVYSL